MIFTFTLKHLKPTGNILKNVMLTEAERQIINKIEQTSQKYLELLEKNEMIRK
jgi:precorrin-6B methylase 2